jgi:glycosyl transferase family 25
MFYKLGVKKFNRFDAIKRDDGILGCVLSHKKVLENWMPDNANLIMVCEDDLRITGDLDELKTLLLEFIKDSNLDVMCLSHNNFDEYPYSERFSITSNTQTTSCYVLKSYMKDIMLKNFNLSIKLLEAKVDKQYKVELDQVWKLLQKKYIFVIPKKRFAFQRQSYSDIQQKIVDYKV